ncbi:SAM-dependent methyltransferase [Elizabethkingia miricola]|uniref:NAD(P)H-binding protein n=1 Tax=Bacteroidota TaxID=976 RepID=UPI000999EA74|nr:NAD(P)H-binding protein [Elizabethkingia miricola]OPC69899.1 SAM-dependent methyltransferase [Elizabethkingia miricola]
MNVLILGAAGKIGRLLTDDLLAQTKNDLVLYAKNGSTRLKLKKSDRVKIVDGDFKDLDTLTRAMDGIDVVYINDMGDDQSTNTIIEAMKKSDVRGVIAASILGIYDEVPGAFGQWNKRMIGNTPRMKAQMKSALAIEGSGLDYTLLRLSWLYDEQGNRNYSLTQKGDPFKGTQVTREAVAQLITDIITTKDERYINKSLGVSEPNTNWDKPSFY